MTHVERIATLPEHQQRAARALLRHVDDRLVADAVHADVPDPIVSYLSGLSVPRLHDVADEVDARDRALDDRLAEIG